MRAEGLIFAVDSHTCGEPTRVITGGLPSIKGDSVVEKRRYLMREMDYVRSMLMNEPRGHSDMFGAVLVPPNDKRADMGVIFMDNGGYINMCGHGSIGSVTVMLETGILAKKEPVTEICLETSAGLVTASATVSGGQVKGVSVRNVPSFLSHSDLTVEVPGIGPMVVDIAFGGNFFALVDGAQLGIDLTIANARRLTDIGMGIREAVNRAVTVRHPLYPHIDRVDLVEIYGGAHGDADGRNIVLFGDGQFDRSPCGTGTCAKMAMLHGKGQAGNGFTYAYESVIGTVFQGEILGETTVGGYPAILPQITGRAFITALQQFMFDPEDPVAFGFAV